MYFYGSGSGSSSGSGDHFKYFQPPPVQGKPRPRRQGKGGPENATCTYKGVYQKRSGEWVAQISEPNGGKRHHLGSFDTAYEAALAYDEIAVEIYGENAILNIPPHQIMHSGKGSSSGSYSLQHEKK